MADFVAVLNKTIDGLGERNTPQMREKVYERAKKAVADKLAAITPAPTEAQAARQFKLLDEAIVTVEASYAPPPAQQEAPPNVIKAAASDPLADFLASVDDDSAKPVLPSVQPKPEIEAPAIIAPSLPELAGASAVNTRSRDPVLSLDEHDQFVLSGSSAQRSASAKTRSSGPLLGLLGLLVIGGAGYGGYVYKDQIQTYLGIGGDKSTAQVAPAKSLAKSPEKAADKSNGAVEKPTEPMTAEPANPVEPSLQKLTQRLTADGKEIDAGPGAKPQDAGEGASVAAATTPSSGTAATTADPALAAQTIAVGQKAIFYEEKTGTERGTADQGAVVWSVVEDSPGLDQPPEPAIRGEINVPDKGIKVRLTIKRNLDKTLPASHIVEMVFTTAPEFTGGTIEGVQRFAMKDTEQAPGNPLVGVPASFGDGFFLIALTDEKSAVEANMSLLSKQQWVDIPVAYGSGRRALLSFEKGIPGDKVFQDVMKAWEAKAAG
jgi:hypothetical protein